MPNVQRQQCTIDGTRHFVETFNETVQDRAILSEIFEKSYGQLYQDMFALWYNRFKKNGYFVDFGATDGITISNTYLLEKDYGWQGIVAEPAKIFHQALFENRSCHISTECVFSQSNSAVLFSEPRNPEWSSIQKYDTDERRWFSGGNEKVYEVNTITLLDLLEKYNAPKAIDYLSIDTEGSEFEILECFDFTKYKINFITVEHNDIVENRDKIYNLLSSKGYDRVWTHMSSQDDWYVLKDI